MEHCFTAQTEHVYLKHTYFTAPSSITLIHNSFVSGKRSLQRTENRYPFLFQIKKKKLEIHVKPMA